MKLSVFIPILNQHVMSKAVIKQLLSVTENDVEIIVLDNGSNPPLIFFESDGIDLTRIKVYRNERSNGVYPAYKQGFEIATGDVVAFFHSDLVVWEKGWDIRVLAHFEGNQRLGMIGFIGSNEIDIYGGRGIGTTSNFQGFTLIDQVGKLNVPRQGGVERHAIEMWRGSPANNHGKSDAGFSWAAVVDGCAMIIRREAWNDIGFRADFPIMHFYDKLISTQLLEKNWKIGVLGIECDHFSSRSMGEIEYGRVIEEWCRANMPENLWRKLSDGNFDGNTTIYQEAERRWLGEYRDRKRIVPIRINA